MWPIASYMTTSSYASCWGFFLHQVVNPMMHRIVPGQPSATHYYTVKGMEWRQVTNFSLASHSVVSQPERPKNHIFFFSYMPNFIVVLEKSDSLIKVPRLTKMKANC